MTLVKRDEGERGKYFVKDFRRPAVFRTAIAISRHCTKTVTFLYRVCQKDGADNFTLFENLHKQVNLIDNFRRGQLNEKIVDFYQSDPPPLKFYYLGTRIENFEFK